MALPDPDGEYIGEHWRNRVLPMAAERGLIMRTPRRQIRSRRALQSALFAREQGRFPELDRAVFKARFEDDADISDIDVLKDLARGVGLDADALGHVLASGGYIDEVNADLRLAYDLGISGVPAMLVGPSDGLKADGDQDEAFFADAEPVIGAVPFEWLAGAIERALAGDRSSARLRRIFRPR